MWRFAHLFPMPSTKSDSSSVALPYLCEVCSPTIPAISGWSSGIDPHPMSVGMTGTPVISANSTSRSQASALMMPPPATMSGRSAAASMSSALSTWPRVATGLYTGRGS